MAQVDNMMTGISPMQPTINKSHSVLNKAISVVLVEEKYLGYVNLRLNAVDLSGIKIANEILAVDLPLVGQMISDNNVTVLGFGPNEWLIVTHSGSQTQLVKNLTENLGDIHSFVVDVTGGMTKLNISGQHAQDMLEKGTYVDLHDSVFKKNALYATQIAHAPAVIIKNASNNYSLIVRRSFSDHIARWAVDAAAEYGYTFT
ncbi:MAG: sarcosine oxidase subunit gamma [Ostreibacterium sp.]